MSWFSNLWQKNKDPSQEANKYYDQIPGQVAPHYDPYINAGKESLDKLKAEYEQMINNPGELYNKLGAGYKESPGYEATLRKALSGANNAAAMGGGGGLGSPGAINNTAQAAGDVANKDFETYLKHVLGLHTEGLGGEQTLETQGQNSDTDYASMLAQITNAKAGNAFNQATGENQQRGNQWSDIFKTIGTVGAGIAGGPVGLAAGNAAANYFFPKK